MAATDSTTYRVERLFHVGDVGPSHGAEHTTWAATRDQAWESLRARIVEHMATALPPATDDLRSALVDLDRAGPRDEGWSVSVDDRAYFYRPRAVGRPASLSPGETVLLLALADTFGAEGERGPGPLSARAPR